ncbi:MAG: 3-deoxy-D-manno-octulosonic acid kinase [Pseudomonadota bacterium]
MKNESILCTPGVFDTERLGLFDSRAWPRSEAIGQGGRGSAWFVGDDTGDYVLRHYRRGGLIGRLNRDLYWFTGTARSRPFLEFRLLDNLHCLGLPVPEPIAARCVRIGPLYRADLLTRRIPDSETLAEMLLRESLDTKQWQSLGWLLKRFHDAGAYHADLNAHNIMRNSDGQFFLIDFDRGELRKPGDWCADNLRRLLRSLNKLAQLHGEQWAGHDDGWQALQAAYHGHR